MYLLTETDDFIVTENANMLVADEYEVCLWPTLEEVKLELGVTGTEDDAFIQRQMNATVANIEKYCGRKFETKLDEEQVHVTYCDMALGYKTKIQLHRWPIIEVQSIVDTADTSRSIEYSIDNHGQLCGQFYLNGTFKINYYGGYGCPLPDDLVDVFYQIVTVRYNSKGSVGVSGEVKSESIPGVIKIDYYQDSSNVSGGGSGSDAATYASTLDFYKAYYV